MGGREREKETERKERRKMVVDLGSKMGHRS